MRIVCRESTSNGLMLVLLSLHTWARFQSFHMANERDYAGDMTCHFSFRISEMSFAGCHEKYTRLITSQVAPTYHGNSWFVHPLIPGVATLLRSWSSMIFYVPLVFCELLYMVLSCSWYMMVPCAIPSEYSSNLGQTGNQHEFINQLLQWILSGFHWKRVED